MNRLITDHTETQRSGIESKHRERAVIESCTRWDRPLAEQQHNNSSTCSAILPNILTVLTAVLGVLCFFSGGARQGGSSQ